jgi:hypothetical protein
VIGRNNTVGSRSAGTQSNVFGAEGPNSIGVRVRSGTGHTVVGNRIGVGRDGTTTVNVQNGILINGATATIGGADGNDRNVIHATDTGIHLTRSSGSKVLGNSIGVGPDGSSVLGSAISFGI